MKYLSFEDALHKNRRHFIFHLAFANFCYLLSFKFELFNDLDLFLSLTSYNSLQTIRADALA